MYRWQALVARSEVVVLRSSDCGSRNWPAGLGSGQVGTPCWRMH
jgi:hypothetical protein